MSWGTAALYLYLLLSIADQRWRFVMKQRLRVMRDAGGERCARVLLRRAVV